MILLLVAACGLVADHFGRPADPDDHEPREFEVPKGASARSLAPALEDAGLVPSASDYVNWVRLTGEGGCIKAGRFELRPDMSAAELTAALCGPPLPEDVPFTVVEGWRIRDIDAALAAKGWIAPGEYAELAAHPERFHADFALPDHALEGYLYPETYMVVPDRWDTAAFIQRQLDLFAERFATPRAADIAASGRDLDAIVILASMVEREEPTPAKRPLVAGILWKRLDHGWNLGVDATSRYTLAEWNDRRAFLKQLRDPTDPYNTRLRPGLPPTAIGNPGLAALDAALHPEESPYWYYLHDGDKVLHPARNAAEHEANRRRYGVW